MKLKLSLNILLAIALIVIIQASFHVKSQTLIGVTVTVTCGVGDPSSYTYTSSPIEPCTASWVGNDGTGGGSVDITYSANTNVGTASAQASFVSDGTYADGNGAGSFLITPGTASCSVSPYTDVPYKGSSYTASASCSSPTGGTPTLNLAGTIHTDAGTYPDTVTLNGSNYVLDVGGTTISITDSITTVDADCSSLTGWSGQYDGVARAATGSCFIAGTSTGLAGLDRGTPIADVPGGTVNWVLTNLNINGGGKSGTVDITITPSPTTVTVDCAPGHFFYTGSPIENCTATVTGDSGPLKKVPLPPDELSYSNNVLPTDSPAASVTATYPGDALGDYLSSNATLNFEIDKAPADCSSVQFPNVTYDGNAHQASGACYISGVAQDTLDLSGATQTNAGNYTFDWALDNAYYSGSGTLKYKILPYTPTCVITPYTSATVTYDGNSHTATGACNGVNGPLAGLNLDSTVHTKAGTYNNDPWTFTTSDTNYTNTQDSVTDSIAQASADCSSISSYTGTYDSQLHGLSGGCSGISSEPSLTVSLGATYTNVPGGPAVWALEDTNYTPRGGSLNVTINRAPTVCTVSPYHVIFNGSTHIASGSCTGVGVESPALNLNGTTHIPADTYDTDTWSMTDSNYYLDTIQSTSTTITDIIDPADASCTIGPSYAVTYDGAAHGASGACTTAGGGATSGLDLGSQFTDWPGGTAHWAFSNSNYNITNASSGDVVITINKKAASVSAVPNSKTYGAADPTLTTTKNGFVAADLASIAFPVTRAPGETVAGSPYLIVVFEPTGAKVVDYTITLTNSNFTITKASPDCSSIQGYSVPYDGNPHNPIPPGACLGVAGETLAGLTAPASHSLPGDWPADAWNFVDVTGNYLNANGSVHDHINFLPANCTVAPYNVPYDGQAHFNTPVCTGGGGSVGTFTNTSRTNAGTYIIPWTFTSSDGIYQDTGQQVTDVISKAQTFTSVNCPPSPTHYYSGSAIIPNPACTAVTTWQSPTGTIQIQSVNLTLQAYFSNNTNAGQANATYNYAGATNFAASSGTGSFTIFPELTKILITCPPLPGVVFTGLAQTPCTAKLTDAINGLNLVPPLVAPVINYGNNIDLSTPTTPATADASYSGDLNHAASVAPQATFQIIKPTITCTVHGYTFTYDENPHTLSAANSGGICTTTDGRNLTADLSYSGSSNIDAGSYPDTVSFHDASGEFADASYPVTNTINKFTPVCDSNRLASLAYNGPYDGNYHGGPVNPQFCTGPKGEDLSAGVTYTPAQGYINVPGGTITWLLPATANYNQVTNTIQIRISRINATCTASGAYNGPYDGTVHTASASCTSPLGENLAPFVTLSSPSSFQYAPGGTVTARLTATNYNAWTQNIVINITRLITTTSVNCTDVVYNGAVQTPCTATVTATDGFSQTLPVTYNPANPTNVGSYNASANFVATNIYGASNGSKTFNITPAVPNCSSIAGYSVPYDGKPHTAGGACTGFGGVSLPGLVLTGTTHIDVGSWNDSWSFNSSNGNYKSTSGFVLDSISPIDPICTGTGYTVTYDGQPHTANITCTGLNGASVGGLNLSGTNHTNAGTYTSDSWSFTSSNGDYNSKTGSVTDTINKADATCTIPDYSVPYDGKAHGAIGSCTGVPGEDLTASLNLGLSFTHVPGGSANWSFANANYNTLTGSTKITITQIESVVTVTCPATAQPYTGSPIEPCTGVTTDAIGSILPLATLTYTNNINVGTATATGNFAGDLDHTASLPNSATFEISGVDSHVTVTCTAGPFTYTGQAQSPCSATFTTEDGLSGPLTPVSYTDNIDAGTVTASANYAGDANHNPSSDSATFVIDPATAACTVTGYTGTYDGSFHTASGTCTGIGGVTLTGLDLSGTSRRDAGNYPNLPWSFTNTNYKSANATVTDNIARAAVTCTPIPYNVTFDGDAHTATGTCLGVLGEPLSNPDMSGTNHTAPGDYTTDTWSFTDLITGNYANATGPVHDIITKANADCSSVTGYTVPYDGSPHTATGTCTGVRGVILNGLDLSGTTHTNTGTSTDTWTFNNTSGNYNTQTGTVTDSITSPTVKCTVNGYTDQAYDGKPHIATGYCVGVDGATITGLDLSGSSHTDAGSYNDTWTFHDVTGNYADNSGTVLDSIAKVEATCSVNPYSLTYDGTSHTATGSCSGLGGAGVSGLDLSGTTHTDAGDYPADAWTLKNTNYFASDTVHDIINKTSATCSITGYTGVYDGLSHAASGDCVSAAGAKLPGLNVGQVYKDVPGGTAGWNFINSNVSNAPITGSVDITLSQAGSTVTVICPASVAFAGAALTPCTAAASGPGGLNQALTVTYTANDAIGMATASASFAGDINHTGSSGSSTFSIDLGTLAGAPLTGGEGSTVAANLKGESGTGLDEKGVVLAALATQPPAATALATSTKELVKSGLGADAKAQNSNSSSGSKSKSSNFWSTYSGLFGCIGSVFLAMLIFFMFKRRREDETEENGAEGSGTDGTGSAAS